MEFIFIRLYLIVTYGHTPIPISLNPRPASAPASVQNPWMGLVDDKWGHIRWYGTTYRTGGLWTVSPKPLETPADTCLQWVGSFPRPIDCQQESARRQFGSHVLVNEENGDVLALRKLLERRLDGGDLGFWERAIGQQAQGGKNILASTMRKFFFCCWFIWPMPASSRPVVESSSPMTAMSVRSLNDAMMITSSRHGHLQSPARHRGGHPPVCALPTARSHRRRRRVRLRCRRPGLCRRFASRLHMAPRRL